ncbi:MAG: Methionine aminopeptidase [uncultured bacterium]|nr:MAG: Methionine aminopeptidase [uncultured bacterium]HBR79530.1 type I methionyl aminopeptidase [Candidatus Moranbacteria bacterium]
MINIKTEKEIEAMREGGKRLAFIMEELEKNVLPGASTDKIDKLAEKLILEADGTPSFKGYGGGKKPFPASICASINSEIVHGIPKKEVILKDGDVFKIDIGMQYQGMHTDMARTFAVGKIDKDKQKLIDTVKESFYQGVAEIKAGKKLNRYCKAVQKYVEKNGFSVVRNLVGHGIGKKLHEYPQIPNYYERGCCKFKLEPGMTFALEPMINVGDFETKLGKDGWVFETRDGSLSAHWENTILITKEGVEILTETE